MAGVLLLLLLALPLAWVGVHVSAVSIDEEGIHPMRPRYIWSRVPEGYAGVVRRRRSTWVRAAGARVAQPMSSVALVSMTALARKLGPMWIATADGGGLTATGTLRYHIADPAKFTASPWARWPQLLRRMVGTGVAEAVRGTGVDPRAHPEVVDREARRLLMTYLGPQGISIDKLQMAFVTGTPEDLADRRREVDAARRSSRLKVRFVDAVMVTLTLWLIGVGVWATVYSLRSGYQFGLVAALVLVALGCWFGGSWVRFKRMFARAESDADS